MMRVAVHRVAIAALLATQIARAGSLAESAGCYVREDDAGQLLLKLSADGSYQAYSNAGLGIWGRATGHWFVEGREITFGPSEEAKGWYHYMQPYRLSGIDATISDGKICLERRRAEECGF